MRSLGGLSVRMLRRSTRRYLLTAVGASLGVAVLFAILVTSGASRDALDDAINGSTGTADVVVFPTGAFDATLPAGTPEMLAGLDGVERIASATGFRTAIQPPGATDDDLSDPTSIREHIAFVTGTGDGFDRINTFHLSNGRRPAAGADEVMVPDRLAGDLGVGVGDVVELATPAGAAEVTVVGLLVDRDAATANQGAIAYTSAETAGRLTGQPGAIRSVQIDLVDGVEPARWIADHREALADVSVQEASAAAAGFRSFIEGVNAALTLVATVAVFIGGFLVHLTFSVAMAERTRILGTLRALGADRRRLRRLVVLEAAALGLVCALVGLVVGFGLAVVAMGVVGALLGLDLGGVGAPVGAAVLSVVTGVVVAIGSAWLPATRASRIDAVSAMRGGSLAIERAPRRWLGPGLLLAGCALDLAAGDSIPVHGSAMLVVLAGAVLSVHLALGPVADVVGRATARLSQGTGLIAVRHLRREQNRSSFTLALVMVAIAMLVAVAGTNQAMWVSLDRILDAQAGAVVVGAPGAIDDATEAEIAAVPGTGVMSPVRFGNVELATVPEPDGTRTSTDAGLQVIDPATYFDVSSLPYIEGDDATTEAALAAGGALVLPEPEANRLGVRRGGVVEVTTTEGPAEFDVVGTYAVIGGGFGAVFGAADLERLGAGRVNGYLVGTDGADPEDVAAAIRDEVAAEHQLLVDSPAELRRFAEAQLAGFFSIAYVILLLAGFISMLGLANTLVVTVLARTREIGVLRSTGAVRGQVRTMVTVEAATMAAVAFLLALPLGGLLTYGIIEVQRRTVATGISYQYPWAMLLPLAVVTLVVAGLAAAGPARRAGRLEIVDALRFE